MTVIWWIIIFILFILSLMGVVVPVLPDTIFLWIAFGLSYFIEGVFPLPVSFWLGMGFITLLILGSDLISNIYITRKYGASRFAVLGSIVGLILGIIFLGPFGIILGPFFTVLLISYLESRDQEKAMKRAWGTVIAFFSSTVAKIILQLIMILWFILIV
ncbi:MAG: DUF456 domain-containing protein [Halanaerobiales bacterium]